MRGKKGTVELPVGTWFVSSGWMVDVGDGGSVVGLIGVMDGGASLSSGWVVV